MKSLLSFLVFVLVFYVFDAHAYKLEINALGKRNVTLFEDVKDASMQYLFRFGYFPTLCTSKTCGLDKKTKKNMIKEYQSFANLDETGVVDAATIKQMQMPRCGKNDRKFKGFTGRQKRYNPQGSVWKKVKRGEPLTWRYGKPGATDANEGITRDLDKDDVRRILKEAMKKWTDVAKIEFREIDESAGDPDIWIYFGARDHGDPYAFDGVGGTLAHAFYPLSNTGISGDMHFDDDERFTEKTSQGRNLLWVATHELGHSIGLAHSNVREAVMYPYYTGYQPGFNLKDDDVLGIQSIYGKVEIPDPAPKPASCPAGITAIWRIPTELGMTFRMTTTSDDGYEVDNSRNIKRSLIRPLKSNADAAFTAQIYSDSAEEVTVVFSGSSYSVYTKDLQLKSGPHSIHQLRDENGEKNPLQLNFPTYVEKIEAAMKWQRNSKLYFFYRLNGVGYYRKYDFKKHRFASTRSRKMDWKTGQRWRGLPSEGPDAVVSWRGGNTYFVVGNEVYKYNDRAVKTHRGYPKQIGKGGFLRCS